MSDLETKTVMDLLDEARRTGVGVAFEPDDEGWRLSYVLPIDWPAYNEYELQAGPLGSAYDLQTAAAASLRPLREMAERIDDYLSRRES